MAETVFLGEGQQLAHEATRLLRFAAEMIDQGADRERRGHARNVRQFPRFLKRHIDLAAGFVRKPKKP